MIRNALLIVARKVACSVLENVANVKMDFTVHTVMACVAPHVTHVLMPLHVTRVNLVFMVKIVKNRVKTIVKPVGVTENAKRVRMGTLVTGVVVVFRNVPMLQMTYVLIVKKVLVGIHLKTVAALAANIAYVITMGHFAIRRVV